MNNDTVISEAEAHYRFAQGDLRRLVDTYGLAAVQEWLMAIHLGLPLRPYHAPTHGTIGEPNRG